MAGISSTMRLTVVDEYFVDNANAHRNDGYVAADLRFGYNLRLGGVEMVPLLGINNLFDARYNSSVVVNASRGNFYEPAPGRNYYVGLRMRTR